jgi:hypothetical protein
VSTIPAIEISHYRHASRIGSPNGERNPVDSPMPQVMRSHLLVNAEMIPFVEKIDIVVAKDMDILHSDQCKYPSLFAQRQYLGTDKFISSINLF